MPLKMSTELPAKSVDALTRPPYLVLVAKITKSLAIRMKTRNILVNPLSVVVLPMTFYDEVVRSNGGVEKPETGLVIVAKNLAEAPDITPQNKQMWISKASLAPTPAHPTEDKEPTEGKRSKK